MIPTLYKSTETNFTRNGIGFLSDCLKCRVTEQLNGIYECEFQYSAKSKFYSEITPDRIIKVKPNEVSNLQLFRVYRNTKPINNVVKFYCQHISYDLNMNIVEPFTQSRTNATTALNAILDHCYYSHRFTAVSTSNTQSKLEIKKPVSARKCLGGMDGSILDNFGGEFEFDNFIIRHYKSRGQDNGVTIQYGKNLTDITADTNISSVYTSVYPFATDADGNYYELPEKVIVLSSANKYGEPRMLELDLSEKFAETQITEELIRQYANNYINNNKIDEIKQNVKISFVQLWQSKEYETISALERVKLGDIVTVKYPALGVSVKAKVIKTVYDVLNERYEEIELGQAKSNFADTLSKVNSELVTMSDFMRNQPSITEKAIQNATNLITGQTGGYVVLKQDNTGYPNEILIMNEPTIETATKLWRWNLGGLGYSSGTNAYQGQYRTAITMDGSIVADFITTGVLNADLIKAGTIQDVNGNMSINMTTGKIIMDMSDNFRSEWWTAGLTFYSPNNVVLTSMFVDRNGKGIVTANEMYVGQRDNEKIILHLDGNGKGVIESDKVITNDVYADKIVVDDITIMKNSNNRLYVDTPIVSNFSLENNGSEVGSFFVDTNNRSLLKTDAILITDTLKIGNNQYSEQAVTINGTTYYVLART